MLEVEPSFVKISETVPGLPPPFEAPEILAGEVCVQVIVAVVTLLSTSISGDSPLQTNVSRVERSIFPVGSTVTIKSVSLPGQLGSSIAVMVIVPEIALPVVLLGTIHVGT